MSSSAIILQSVNNGENLITLVWGFREPSALIQFLTNIPVTALPLLPTSAGLILQVHLVRHEIDIKGWRCLNSGHSRHRLPVPRRAFSTAVTLGGPSDVCTMTDRHWASLSLPKPPALHHILHSPEPGRRHAFLRGIFVILKGNSLSREKQPKYLHLP